MSAAGEALTLFRSRLESLRDRRVVLFGGKGGAGKTTVAALAALLLSRDRKVVLFTSDPASNLGDLFDGAAPSENLAIEQLDAEELYASFLHDNLESILELADRGTILDRDEARRFFELALPGIDELMAWLRIGALAADGSGRLVIVDTAPTGHTLRMLSSSAHFREFVDALAAMQRKHKDLIEQFTRRSVHDALDEFLVRIDAQAEATTRLLTSSEDCAFIPVTLAEPWVMVQSARLIEELRAASIPVPFAILNRAPSECDCAACVSARGSAPRTLAGVETVALPDACAPLDSAERLQQFVDGALSIADAPKPAEWSAGVRLALPAAARLIFFAGKGGVGKTTVSSAVALATATQNPERRYVVISVDPAHTLRDVFAKIEPPPNLRVELIDTRERWRRFRESLGEEIAHAFDAITPRGLSLTSDLDVMQRLVEVAPPGADELFAINRLAELASDTSLDAVFVDTAPTGHFLRLVDLPAAATEWVREFMRLLLRYRELIAPGSLGEELLHSARALRAFDELLRSESTAAVLVTRPERIVAAETTRLATALGDRSIAVAGTIANYVTPPNSCRCDSTRRAAELETLAALGPVTTIERRATPPSSLDDLRGLVPMMQTRR